MKIGTMVRITEKGFKHWGSLRGATHASFNDNHPNIGGKVKAFRIFRNEYIMFDDWYLNDEEWEYMEFLKIEDWV